MSLCLHECSSKRRAAPREVLNRHPSTLLGMTLSEVEGSRPTVHSPGRSAAGSQPSLLDAARDDPERSRRVEIDSSKPGAGRLRTRAPATQHYNSNTRRGGGTGRRMGLKIPRPQGRAGSIPAPGTHAHVTRLRCRRRKQAFGSRRSRDEPVGHDFLPCGKFPTASPAVGSQKMKASGGRLTPSLALLIERGIGE
jgi:hypothetical protein